MLIHSQLYLQFDTWDREWRALCRIIELPFKVCPSIYIGRRAVHFACALFGACSLSLHDVALCMHTVSLPRSLGCRPSHDCTSCTEEKQGAVVRCGRGGEGEGKRAMATGLYLRRFRQSIIRVPLSASSFTRVRIRNLFPDNGKGFIKISSFRFNIS